MLLKIRIGRNLKNTCFLLNLVALWSHFLKIKLSDEERAN